MCDVWNILLSFYDIACRMAEMVTRLSLTIWLWKY